MGYRVRNWERWQSYRRDRDKPPWIKIYRRLLLDPSWAMLSDAEKGQLVSLWILAGDRDGALPEANLLQKLCQLDSAPPIAKFVSLGFIETCEDAPSIGCHRDVSVTSSWRQNDAPDTETETETDQNPPYAPPVGGSEREAGEGKPKRKRTPSTLSQAALAEFERFWVAYPRREKRGDAENAWAVLKPDPATVDSMLKALAWQRECFDWTKDGGQFIPGPGPYLRQKRWLDEPRKNFPTHGNGRHTENASPEAVEALRRAGLVS